MLRESEHIEEQGDILQYLIDTKGQNFDTGNFIRLILSNRLIVELLF